MGGDETIVLLRMLGGSTVVGLPLESLNWVFLTGWGAAWTVWTVFCWAVGNGLIRRCFGFRLELQGKFNDFRPAVCSRLQGVNFIFIEVAFCGGQCCEWKLRRPSRLRGKGTV